MYYPSYPNAPKDNSESNRSSAAVNEIFVYSIPYLYRNSLLEHQIAVYGSVDKIPQSVMTTMKKEILAESISGDVYWYGEGIGHPEYTTTNYTTFKGHMAYNLHSKMAGGSTILAVMLDNDTIAVIRVNSHPDIVIGDERLFKGTDDDILNSLTITKA